MRIYRDLLFESIGYTPGNNTIIYEMGYSKEDLQNPNTIKRIIGQRGRFESVAKFLDFICSAIEVIGPIIVGIKAGVSGKNDTDGEKSKSKSNPILSGFAELVKATAIITLLMEAAKSAINSMPQTKEKKRIIRFKDEAIRLRDKMSENEDAESKKIVENCNEAIKAADKYLDSIDIEKFQNEVSAALDAYREFILYLNNPTLMSTDEPDIYNIAFVAKNIGTPEVAFINAFKKKTLDSNKKHITVCYDEDYPIIFDIFDSKFKRLNELDGGSKVVTFYEEFYNTRYITFGKDALIEADRILGYYMLSNCPYQVERKPLPKF